MTKQEAYRRISQFEDRLRRQAKQLRARRIAAGALPALLVGGSLAAHPMPPETAPKRSRGGSRRPPQVDARIRQIEKDRKRVERVLADYLLDALVALRPSRRGAKRQVTLTALYDYTREHPDDGFRKIAAHLHRSTFTVKPLLKVLEQLRLYQPKSSPQRP